MLKSFFGFLGAVLTSLYYILSSKSFTKLCKVNNNNLEGINFNKILFNYMVAYFSYFYSDFGNFSSMINCNKFSVFFCLILLIIYVLFELRTDFIDAILNILLISITSLTFRHYFRNILVDENIFGYYFLFSNMILLLYILYENYNDYKNKINILFNHYLNILYTSSAFCWLVYGFLYEEFYLKVTFGIETLCGIILIILIIWNKYYEYFCADYNRKNIQSMNGNTIEFVEDKRNKYENI